MSLIAGYLNQVGQVKRSGAAIFYEGSAVVDLPLEITEVPGEAFKVKATVSAGAACTGTIVISGFQNSTPKSETLTYDQCRTRTSTTLFTSITSLVTSGLADEDPVPHIRAVAVDAGGAELTATTWEDFACRWEQKSVSYWTDLGNLTLSDAKVMTEAEIEAGDWIRLYPDDSIVGHEVKSVKPATGLAGAEEFRTLLL